MAAKAAEVIGAVIDNKDIYAVMGENTELFGAYGDVFESMRSHYTKHKEIPDRSMLAAMHPDVDIPTVSGATAYHLDALKSEFVERRMEEIMIKAAQAKKDLPAGDRLNKLMTSLAKLGQYTTAARDLSLNDYENAEEHFNRMRAAAEENGGSPGIRTGWDAIDATFPTGLAPGQSITLIGYSGKGKSMWSGKLGDNIWRQGYKVMVISLEMTAEEYRDRMYAMHSDGAFKISQLQRGDVDPDDFRSFANKSLKDSADFIVVSNEGNADVTPNFIQAKIDIHKPDLVILDYLQLMSDNAHTGDMTRRMLNLSREIKLLATSAAVPIISISAVTDEDNDKRDGPPLISQISWSKGIEYDSTLVIAIHRHDGTNIVEVVGRKNRHGDLFSMFFEVDFDSGIWTEKFSLE